jgi:SAM-dependent methyltransferase
MNWHETIEFVRKDPKYAELVKQAYFDQNLAANIERFRESEEFVETMKIISQVAPEAKTILDIGAGNGISSVNFALKGFTVTAVEPDSSESVGANAIRFLKKYYSLETLTVVEQFAEDIGFPDNSFDVVYVRQAMHHANDLNKFVSECARVLKPGGIFLSVRDHIIFDEIDKARFLDAHPLHKFYQGENAFTPYEYKNAMISAGLTIVEELKHNDSVINYFPISTKQNSRSFATGTELRNYLRSKIGRLADFPLIFFFYKMKIRFAKSASDEKNIPGRMYSYIARKKFFIAFISFLTAKND